MDSLQGPRLLLAAPSHRHTFLLLLSLGTAHSLWGGPPTWLHHLDSCPRERGTEREARLVNSGNE